MKIIIRSSVAACLAVVAVAASPVIVAAQGEQIALDLAAAKASGRVTEVYWESQDDAQVLQLRIPMVMGRTISCLRGLDPTFGATTTSRMDGIRQQVVAAAAQQPASLPGGSEAMPEVAEALSTLMPRNIVDYMPLVTAADVELQAAEGAQVVRRQPKRVQAWLLRADGTTIPPALRTDDILASDASCEERNRRMQVRASSRRAAATRANFEDEIQFRFPLSGNGQAVAVAIQLDDDYYIEKLQPGQAAQ